ncbi:MAG: tetratricopeptide repeat protein, partial [Candidatus Omnitrophica bacterium]|nr:tetratricopeptide repeat protein [Candidatus Omnitrophota bacterium]MBD3269676.1 tetratricopeptide repeat protein [Candidatus Omnitrophota bacterium]
DEGAAVSLGYVYNKQHKFSEAEEVFKKVLELNPDNEKAREGLQICIEAQKRDSSLSW